MKTVLRAALAAAIVVVMGGTAMAQHEERFRRDEHWRGDIHHFDEYDLAYWRGGHWFNGFHGGRRGWWWIVGDSWYFYPAPIYPYPNPYLPPGAVPAAGPAWYYCADPPGYYPYVGECAVPWQPVSAVQQAPQQAAPPPQPPAPPQQQPLQPPPPPPPQQQ